MKEIVTLKTIRPFSYQDKFNKIRKGYESGQDPFETFLKVFSGTEVAIDSLDGISTGIDRLEAKMIKGQRLVQKNNAIHSVSEVDPKNRHRVCDITLIGYINDSDILSNVKLFVPQNKQLIWEDDNDRNAFHYFRHTPSLRWLFTDLDGDEKSSYLRYFKPQAYQIKGATKFLKRDQSLGHLSFEPVEVELWDKLNNKPIFTTVCFQASKDGKRVEEEDRTLCAIGRSIIFYNHKSKFVC